MEKCETKDCKGFPRSKIQHSERIGNSFGFCKHCTKKSSLKYRMEYFKICKVIGCYQMAKKESSFCGSHVMRLCIRYGNYYCFDVNRSYATYLSSLKKSYIDKYFFIFLYPNGKNEFVSHKMHDNYNIAITPRIITPRIRSGRCYLFGPIKPIDVPHNTEMSYKYLSESKIDKYVFESGEPIVENIGLILVKHIVLIQRAWRRCRYEPEYLMCNRIQLRELAELGVIEEENVP